ncbi:hypothetical protein L6452_21341 [Arctium lappa]|uniref:Uncharacterized protein n=1 Tax=Arctium lappa TaxID=4217 RepID=A0ACB9BDY9_ARCLA|nr:hypothetical protein L6452_21341 [Arctium lappa]
MDCNRDEATRAKEISETKFSAKDIMGAKKFALKAQSLYPGLDGISQLLAILDVYVAAENKINGELDYYGILGVSPLADDDTVRKHYRKLALSLHPDKNKSIGADGAFKYVSEAWNLLSDKDKRTTYDHKRNGRVFKQRVRTQNGGSGAPTPSGKNGFYNFTKSTVTRTKGTTSQTKGTTSQTKGTTNSPRDNTNVTDKKGPRAVPSSSNKQTDPTPVPSPSDKQITPKTFWTVCKRCKLQYEFVRMYLNRNLLCPTCHGPFLAIETPPPNTNGSSEVPEKVQGAGENGSNPTSKDTSSKWAPFLKTANPAAVFQAASMVQQAYEKVKRDREEAQADTKRKEAFRRKISKKAANSSSKHSNSVKTKPDVDGLVANKETRPVGSSISSGQVDIKKDVSNAGIKNQLIKKATMEIRKKLHEWSSEAVIDSTVRGVGEKGNEKEKGKVDGFVNGDSNNHRNEPVATDVPDPDFHDFDHDRSEKCFEQGQVWAAYDDHDGMPRYYAMIQKVISIDPFKMKVCWLYSTPKNHPNPSSGFLKAFGEFKAGKHEIVSVPNYFSHKANFTKLANGNIRVFPRKQDVCALFRNDKKHKYDIVEVDEYDEGTGITVTPLIKVAEFKTVFHRHINPKETRVVLENEIIQFSHKIPSYLLTGQESPNAPKGCLELDPAAIPAQFLQVTENGNQDDDEMLQKDCVSK